MEFAIFLAMISILDTMALVAARFYIESRKKWMFCLSIASFFVSGYVFVRLMEFAVTAIVNVLFIAFSTGLVTFIFYFVFKEKITKGQILGLLLVAVGISILNT